MISRSDPHTTQKALHASEISDEDLAAIEASVTTTVHLTIDGDHACALLGVNLQEGEAEFVKVEDMNSQYSKNCAARKAFKKLEDRLGMGRLGYYVGEGVASPLAMRNPDDR